MKQLIASALLLLPALVLVTPAQAANTQTSTQKSAASAKKAAPAKAATASKKTAAASKTTSTSRTATARKAAALSAGAGGAAVAAAAVAPRTLNPTELALAERVHTGRIACKSNTYVNVLNDAQNPGHFVVSGSGFSFHMSPVATTTGVVRLEDANAGAVWLQIANKSMLMNQKQGKRLADECMSPQQLQVAEAIKKNPPKSLLEPSK